MRRSHVSPENINFQQMERKAKRKSAISAVSVSPITILDEDGYTPISCNVCDYPHAFMKCSYCRKNMCHSCTIEGQNFCNRCISTNKELLDVVFAIDNLNRNKGCSRCSIM